MRKLLLFFMAIGIVFAGSGCITQKAHYLFNLESVQRPREVTSQYGVGSFEYLTFEDSLCKVVFSPEERGIGFDLTNKSNRTIKIVWDEVAYVDQYKSSHRVLHLGTKFIHSDRPQPVSSVPVNAKLDDLIVPTVYAEWRTSTSRWVSSGWRIRSLFPETSGLFDFAPANPLKDVVYSLNGGSVSIFLPLKVGDQVNEYLFVFRVRAWIQ